MAIALEAYDPGTELAAEKMDGSAAEIRIRGAMDLLAPWSTSDTPGSCWRPTIRSGSLS